MNTVYIKKHIHLQELKQREMRRYLLRFKHKQNKSKYKKDNIKITYHAKQILQPALINNKYMNIYTDGACSNNGKCNAKAGIGIYFSKNDSRNISKSIEGKQTNNTAELMAVITVFDICKKQIDNLDNIRIYTDSEYVINCCTTFGDKCHNTNWKVKKTIQNIELVKQIYYLFKKK